MSSDLTHQAVTEYLRELELRLTGLPVLQRRELLADLGAHITNERAERGAVTEAEVLDILERLGSPEVVAAAAYEEAGLFASREPVLSHAGGQVGAGALPAVAPPPDSPPPAYAGPFPPHSGSGAPADHDQAFARTPPAGTGPGSSTGLRVVIGLAIAAVVVVVLGCLGGGLFLARNSAPASGTSTVERAPVEQPGITDPQPAEPAPPAPTVD